MTPHSCRHGALAALVLAVLLAAPGCGREQDGGVSRLPTPAEPADEAAPAPETFDRTWLGVLPCTDCDGIQTRLQLRADPDGARYLLEETYLGGPGENRFVQEGTWREEAAVIEGQPAEVYRLDPDGPGRWFWVRPDGGLEMLEAADRPAADGLAYRLQRL